jgi:hypothetical protein
LVAGPFFSYWIITNTPYLQEITSLSIRLAKIFIICSQFIFYLFGFVYIFFETESSYVVLNSGSSCLSLLSSGITCMYTRLVYFLKTSQIFKKISNFFVVINFSVSVKPCYFKYFRKKFSSFLLDHLQFIYIYIF